MEESSKTIIEHIPRFLDYCKEVGLSERTYENYKHYLNKFIYWLKEKNKESLLPHNFTTEDISAYCLYLTQFKDKKGRSLKKVTQNYYLIALRALLGYFTTKDIVSLPADKVALPKDAKAEKTVKFLNLDQIEKLLLVPDTNTKDGLRDRAILGVLISTGLKVKQLVNLNRNQLNDIPAECLTRIKEYLKTREDKNKALFVNYKSRKNADKRLTVRSVERIVNRYGRKINLPFLITPEILRWSRANAILEEEVEIKRPNPHKTLKIKNYDITISENICFTDDKEESKNYFLDWHIIENFIKKEQIWLKNNIPVMPEGYKINPSFLKCDNCILRKVAVLIISGKVRVVEFKSKNNEDLWNNLTGSSNIKKMSRHGRGWHKRMMDVIHEYFELRNYKVNLEPILNYGRADLGINLGLNRNIYIEIGTVSLFKLWYNFSTMKNTTFLIVPDENYAIEFNT